MPAHLTSWPDAIHVMAQLDRAIALTIVLPPIARLARTMTGNAYSAAAACAGCTEFGPNRSRNGCVSISSSSISRARTLRFHS